MTMAPENKPPTPIPATARPMISAMLLGAVAHTSELYTHVNHIVELVGKHSRLAQSQKQQSLSEKCI